MPGPRFAVYVGDKLVDYSEDFKLFMTTRNPNLDVSPDALAIVTAVNFTTTRAGLISQVIHFLLIFNLFMSETLLRNWTDCCLHSYWRLLSSMRNLI